VRCSNLNRSRLALFVLLLLCILLWPAIAATTIVFWRRSTPAGILFVPYLVWVSFAAALNCAIWRLKG
jgi:translocator protein